VDHPLEGVDAKLDRAYRHTKDLETTIEGFLQTALYVAVTEGHFEEGEHIGYFLIRAREHTEHPVNVIGAAIGDIVHNLRSALDHLAWQLAILAGNNPPPENTEYPVFKDEAQYRPKNIKLGKPPPPGSGLFKVRGLAADDHALIESLQPYKTHVINPASAPLWVLHDLANIDKHRICPVTIPVVSWARLPGRAADRRREAPHGIRCRG
jgi:hypothetical protein